MTQEPFDPTEDARRDRREHGGAPSVHPDEDDLARRTEEERVEAGVDDYDPDEVPPATDDPVPTDLTETEDYAEEQAEIKRQTGGKRALPADREAPLPTQPLRPRLTRGLRLSAGPGVGLWAGSAPGW